MRQWWSNVKYRHQRTSGEEVVSRLTLLPSLELLEPLGMLSEEGRLMNDAMDVPDKLEVRLDKMSARGDGDKVEKRETRRVDVGTRVVRSRFRKHRQL